MAEAQRRDNNIFAQSVPVILDETMINNSKYLSITMYNTYILGDMLEKIYSTNHYVGMSNQWEHDKINKIKNSQGNGYGLWKIYFILRLTGQDMEVKINENEIITRWYIPFGEI